MVRGCGLVMVNSFKMIENGKNTEGYKKKATLYQNMVASL